jgi:hypothetical protein
MIFECSTYEQERDTLKEKIGLRHFNLRSIMSNTDHMKALATFLNKTGRLRKKEQCHVPFDTKTGQI